MSGPPDSRICKRCPLGPDALMHPECNRCVADIQAVTDRRTLADSLRHKLVYDGVEYADAILYLVLPNMLPRFDPATAKETLH
jgi:hypothetical protein